jgi:hypothetical protein
MEMQKNPERKLSILAILSFCMAIGMFLSAGITWRLAMLVTPVGRIMGQLIVISFFTPLPLFLVAIITSSIAIRQIKKHNLRGLWMAIAVIVLGSLGFLFFTFYLVYTLNLARALSVG